MLKQPILEIFTVFLSLLGILFMFHSAFAQTPTSCVTLPVSLAQGSRGPDVTALQGFLHAHNYLAVEPTGYFGPATVKAVKAFQAAQHVAVVGTVGPLTRAAIKTASCVQATASAPAPASAPLPAPVAPAPTPTSVAPTSAPVVNANVALPYHAPQFSGWSGTWGDVSVTDTGTLLLKAGTSTTGAEALFPQSKTWTDYRISANVLTKSTDILLFARFVDPKNFLMCIFSDNYITIKERLNGVDRVLTSGQVPNMSSNLTIVRSTSVSMRVKGNTVGCSEMGPDDNLTYNNVDASLSNGGIGFDIWNQNLNFSSMEVKSVDVTAI